jgi:hypothetical protein
VAFGRTEGSTDATQTKDATNRGGSDGFEGLAAGSSSRQGFGQVVKAGGIHPSLLLSCFAGRPTQL